MLDEYEQLEEPITDLMSITARSQEPARRQPAAGRLQLQLKSLQ
jgi:hypothetical protein